MKAYIKRIAERGLSGLAIIFLVIVLFLTSIEKAAFDIKFYANEYRKLNVAQGIDMSDGELMRVTEELLNYLKDERKDLNIVGVVKGESQLIFNEREMAHMVDVKDLFLKGMTVRAISIGVFLISLMLLYWLAKKRIYKYLAYSILRAFAAILFLGIALAILMYQDFTPVWDQFHYIFFSNDLWQLNPETDILIQMVPEQFFFDMVKRILYLFGGAMVVLFVPSLVAVIKNR